MYSISSLSNLFAFWGNAVPQRSPKLVSDIVGQKVGVCIALSAFCNQEQTAIARDQPPSPERISGTEMESHVACPTLFKAPHYLTLSTALKTGQLPADGRRVRSHTYAGTGNHLITRTKAEDTYGLLVYSAEK